MAAWVPEANCALDGRDARKQSFSYFRQAGAVKTDREMPV
jgi:hypothetical protein